MTHQRKVAQRQVDQRCPKHADGPFVDWVLCGAQYEKPPAFRLEQNLFFTGNITDADPSGIDSHPVKRPF
jgi:hypothetical protein